jgi:hypothetical protein
MPRAIEPDRDTGANGHTDPQATLQAGAKSVLRHP